MKDQESFGGTIFIDSETMTCTVHPDAIAYGDTDHGWLIVPGWPGAVLYARCNGFAHHGMRSVCIGDVVCALIENGTVPLRPADEMPSWDELSK